MTQEEYSKSFREWRKQQRAENNMEYMERYRQQLEVGDCVYVSCDGPGPCAGRVKEITNKGITINKLRNEKVQEVFIEWCYIRGDFQYKVAYSDLVAQAEDKFRLSKLVGKTCRVATSNGEVAGKVIEKLSDALIISTAKGHKCIMDIDVTEIITL